MDNQHKGLYQKYSVTKLNSGKDVTAKSFVLELTDPHARVAVLAYAESLDKIGEKDELVHDLKSWVSKYQTTDSDKQYKAFDRLVLLKGHTTIDPKSILVINPEDSADHVEDDDIVMSAILNVDVTKYMNHKKNEQNKIDTKEVLALKAVAKFVIAEFMDNPEHTSLETMWNKNKEFYTQTFNQDSDILWEEINKQFVKD